VEGEDHTIDAGAGKERQPRVLVVDAETAILTLLSKSLPAYGLEVVAASGLSDAAEALMRHPGGFALVLLGANEPEGLRTWAWLRKVQPTLRSVFMTGGLGNAAKDRLTELGALAVVSKPFKMDQLAALLLRLADPTWNGEEMPV
jgi:DNA-binding NtrC family response regulator